MALEFQIKANIQTNVPKEGKAINDTLATLQGSIKSTESAFSSFSKQAAAFAAGQIIAEGLLAAASAAFEFGKALAVNTVNEALEGEEAVNRLSVALALAGQYTKENVKDFEDFATALSTTTKFTNNQIITTGAYIESLTKLSNEGLKQATQASLDLAAATGKDVNTAATAVAKALNGSSEALNKFGIDLDVAKGKTLSQSEVLRQLSERFGGAAIANAQSFGGALKILGNTFENLFESIGKVIIQNPALNAAFQQFNKALLQFSAFIERNSGLIGDFITKAITGFISILPYIAATIKSIGQIGIAISSVVGVVLFFGGIFTTIFLGIIRAVTITADVIASFFARLFEGVPIIGKVAEYINRITTALAFVSDKATEGGAAMAGLGKNLVVNGVERFDAFGKSVDDAYGEVTKFTDQVLIASKSPLDTSASVKQLENMNNAAKSTTQAIQELTEAQKLLQKDALSLVPKEGIEGTRDQLKQEEELLQAKRDQDLISEQEFLDAKAQLQIEALEAERIREDEAYAQKLITKQQYEQARLETEQKIEIQRQKNAAAQAKFDRDNQKRQYENTKSSLGQIATLMNSNSKELFAIGKASAIANATLLGAEAVLRALATPFPLNIILPPLVAVSVGAQIAAIASAKPPALATGIDSVPKGFENDTFAAFLSSGERVVPKDTNRELTEFLANQRDGGGSSITSEEIQAIANRPVVVQINGKEIFNVIREELRGGRVLA